MNSSSAFTAVAARLSASVGCMKPAAACTPASASHLQLGHQALIRLPRHGGRLASICVLHETSSRLHPMPLTLSWGIKLSYAFRAIAAALQASVRRIEPSIWPLGTRSCKAAATAAPPHRSFSSSSRPVVGDLAPVLPRSLMHSCSCRGSQSGRVSVKCHMKGPCEVAQDMHTVVHGAGPCYAQPKGGYPRSIAYQ